MHLILSRLVLIWIMFVSQNALGSNRLVYEEPSAEGQASASIKTQSDFVGTITSQFKNAINGGGIILPILLALLAGFLTSLSPCVYPLIPITLSIMGARKYDSHLQGFLVSLVYVLGMTIVYTILGATFAYLGILLGSFMQSAIMLYGISILFLLLSFYMFGVFNLVLPSGLLNKLSKVGGGGYKGAFLMGLVAGVVAAPCTGPVLGFILTIIANQKDLLFGTMLMFAFSIGIGILFLFLGSFSSIISKMPKSGNWMTKVKYIFGVFMLSASFYYVSLANSSMRQLINIIFGETMYVNLLLIICGFILLLTNIRYIKNKALELTQKTAGAILSGVGIAVLLTIQGNSASTKGAQELDWHIIDGSNKLRLDDILDDAKKNNTPVIIDFYADWCIVCKKIEKDVFSHKDVINTLKNLKRIKIDATNESPSLNKLFERFQVNGLPTIVFFDKEGKRRKEMRIIGYISAKDFLTNIRNKNLLSKNIAKK